MKQQLMSAAFGLVLAGSVSGTATPVSAEVTQAAVFHGCIVTVGDDYVVIRATGSGGGPRGLYRVQLTGATELQAETTEDACVAIVVYQEDDVWYAQAVTAYRDEEGEVHIEQRSGSRPAWR